MNSSSSAWQAAGESLGDVEDRAVVLAQADRAVGPDGHVGEIALVGLDDRKLADAVDQRCILVDPIGHLLADAITELASTRREHLVDEVVAADRLDRGQQARGKRVVVRGEQVLGVGRDVVQMSWPTHAVTHGLAGDEVGRLEGTQLLEHARAAGAEAFGELIG